MARTVRVCRDQAELAEHAAELIADAAREAVEARGVFSLCLSGGDTPGETYRRLAAEFADSVPWEHVHVFWGDERCIPLDRPDNHFTLATETLLSHVPIPAENVHRARGEADDPTEAAAEYEAELRDFFSRTGDGRPEFDLVILGMGEDGHVASLFPGSDGHAERYRWVVDHFATKRGERVRRLTLTLPVFAEARRIMVLVAGTLKAAMLADVLARESSLPARQVDDAAREIVWLADADAASALAMQNAAGCGR